LRRLEKAAARRELPALSSSTIIHIIVGMLIGERLRELRAAKKLSQGDMEKRTGLLRCYTSRVENGHTVPALETLEKYARALEIPLYRLFYEGNNSPEMPKLPASKVNEWGSRPKQAAELRTFAKLLSRMSEQDQSLLLATAQRMAGRTRTK
jgi:transcriptional regulator with XRE-family HTH domain